MGRYETTGRIAALAAQWSATNFSATAGLAFSTVLASFQDSDHAGALGDYTATINWGEKKGSG
jgi:hypothetical protein